VAPGKNVAGEMNVNICSAIPTHVQQRTHSHIKTVIPWQNDQINKLQNLLALLKYTWTHTHREREEIEDCVVVGFSAVKAVKHFVSNLAFMIRF